MNNKLDCIITSKVTKKLNIKLCKLPLIIE